MIKLKEFFFSNIVKSLKKNWKFYTIGGIILLIYVIFYFYFSLNYTQNGINSDGAGEILMGKIQAEQKSLIPYEVGFVSEIRLFDIQFFESFLFYIFDDWITILSVANTICIVIYFICTIYLLKNIGISQNLRLFFSFIFLMPFSMSYFSIGLGFLGGFYLPKLCIETLFLGLFYYYFNLEKTKRKNIFYILLLLSIISGIKSIRLTLVIYLPLSLTSLILWIKDIYDRKLKLNKSYKECFNGIQYNILNKSFIFLLINGIGFIFNRAYCNYIYNSEIYKDIFNEFSFGNLSDLDLFTRISDRIYKFLDCLGYSNKAEIFSLAGIKNNLIIILIILFIFCVKSIIRNSKDYSKNQIHITVFTVLSLLFNFYIFIFTGGAEFTGRYFVPVIVLVFIVFAIYFNQNKKLLADIILKYGMMLILTVCVILSSFNTIEIFSEIDINSKRMNYINFLESNGYNFGYSTYWNGSITTCLTNGNVEVANITSPVNMNYFFVVTDEKYYSKNYHNGKCFILLTAKQADEWKQCKVLQSGMLVYNDDNYVIYHYDNTEILFKAVL